MGNIAIFSGVAAIVIRLMLSPCMPGGLTDCSVVTLLRNEMFAACCHDAMLRSIVAEASAFGGKFTVLVVKALDTEIVITFFFHRYFEGAASAVPIIILSRRPASNDRK